MTRSLPARFAPRAASERPRAAKPPRRPLPLGRLLAAGGGVVVLLLGWGLLAAHFPRAIVPTPGETFTALGGLIASGALLDALTVTLGRLLITLAIGGLIGLGLGLAAGFVPLLRAFLEPLRWVSMSLPAIFIAVLGMLWFGMGDTQVIFLVSVVITPIIYVNTLTGVDTLDRQLLEMGRVYRFSRRQIVSAIVLPGISPAVLGGLTLAAGMGVRAVVMAEMLGAFSGVGQRFNAAWTFLKTPEMFAWLLVSLGLMSLLEFGLLAPLRRRVMRWQEERHAPA